MRICVLCVVEVVFSEAGFSDVGFALDLCSWCFECVQECCEHLLLNLTGDGCSHLFLSVRFFVRSEFAQVPCVDLVSLLGALF